MLYSPPPIRIINSDNKELYKISPNHLPKTYKNLSLRVDKNRLKITQDCVNTSFFVFLKFG